MTEIPESIETKIAVIGTNISYVQKDISDIKVILKENYATKDALSEVALATENRLKYLEKNNNLWKWLSPILAAGLAAVIEYLFIFYIQHIK